MKAIRFALWAPHPVLAAALEPAIIIMMEEDLSCTLDHLIEQQTSTPGLFVTYRIIEAAGDSLLRTATEAALDDDFQHEHHMAVLYYWDANVLTRARAHGTVTSTQPSPLSVEDIEYTLRQLALHPNYEHQRVMCHSIDGLIVEMVDGECKVLETA